VHSIDRSLPQSLQTKQMAGGIKCTVTVNLIDDESNDRRRHEEKSD
jgi:hypothetical protein